MSNIYLLIFLFINLIQTIISSTERSSDQPIATQPRFSVEELNIMLKNNQMKSNRYVNLTDKIHNNQKKIDDAKYELERKKRHFISDLSPEIQQEINDESIKKGKPKETFSIEEISNLPKFAKENYHNKDQIDLKKLEDDEKYIRILESDLEKMKNQREKYINKIKFDPKTFNTEELTKTIKYGIKEQHRGLPSRIIRNYAIPIASTAFLLGLLANRKTHYNKAKYKLLTSALMKIFSILYQASHTSGVINLPNIKEIVQYPTLNNNAFAQIFPDELRNLIVNKIISVYNEEINPILKDLTIGSIYTTALNNATIKINDDIFKQELLYFITFITNQLNHQLITNLYTNFYILINSLKNERTTENNILNILRNLFICLNRFDAAVAAPALNGLPSLRNILFNNNPLSDHAHGVNNNGEHIPLLANLNQGNQNCNCLLVLIAKERNNQSYLKKIANFTNRNILYGIKKIQGLIGIVDPYNLTLPIATSLALIQTGIPQFFLKKIIGFTKD